MIHKILRFLIPPRFRPGMMADRKMKKVLAGVEVLAGPFKGMKYVDRSYSSSYKPKLFGSYEKEIHHALEDVFQHPIEKVIDVGAAEGYYAVGCALRIADAQIIAFETDKSAQKLIRKMSELNSVSDRVSVNGHCSRTQFIEVLGHGLNFVIVDIEGAEIEMLDSESAKSLANSIIIFESHHPQEVIENKILIHFKASHNHRFIGVKQRSYKDIEQHFRVRGWNRWYINKGINAWISEGRSNSVGWFLLTPKNKI